MLQNYVRALCLGGILSLAALPAGPTILIVSAPTITNNGPNDFTWDYDVFLAAGSELLPPGTACASTIPGGICDGLLTIYDFNGYMGGSISTTAAGWTSLAPVPIGVTPLGLVPTDGAALNLSWAYTGTAPVVAGAAPLLLGVFSADSTFGNSTLTDYTARSVVRINGNAVRSANLDTTTAPIAPQQPTIPEPGTVLLLGTALLGMGWFRSRNSRAE